jgi:hypothetical protein
VAAGGWRGPRKVTWVIYEKKIQFAQETLLISYVLDDDEDGLRLKGIESHTRILILV